MNLLDRWVALFRSPDPAVTAAGRDLIARWSEPHRRYHTVAHLTRMLDVVDAYGENAIEATAVRLACWFHDAIYDTTRPDNEERSADLAASMLGALGVPSHEVVRLVRLTATHEVATGDRDGALIADADLAILATEPSTYADYARAVRDEYAFVPEADFRRERAAILSRFLQRPVIYRLPQLRAAWEERARSNITAEIDALAGADPIG